MQSFALLALATAVASASILPRQVSCLDPSSEACQEEMLDYLQGVCYPTNATGYPDFDAPCAAVELITLECIYGADVQDIIAGNTNQTDDTDTEDYPMLSNATQRLCVCQSQFFTELQGCNDCFTAHGAGDNGLGAYMPVESVSSASASYCAVTNTPTLGLADVLYGFATANSSMASTANQTSLFSDPIGNKTAVSYYFTPSVTGTAAYDVPETSITPTNSTSTGSGGSRSSASSTSMSMLTSDGQIVATASAVASGSATGTASGASSSASTTGKSGAGKQEAAAVAGVIAMAGFVAML